MNAAWLIPGVVLTVLGVVMLFAPGPGLLPLLLGITLIVIGVLKRS